MSLLVVLGGVIFVCFGDFFFWLDGLFLLFICFNLDKGSVVLPRCGST